MKKLILLCILIFATAVSPFGVMAQSDETQQLSVLEEIGVLPAGFSGVYLPESKITIGEMLAIMQNIMYDNKYGTYDDEKAFADAVAAGYFGADKSTRYYDNAKYEHVIEAALNILGYGAVARQKSGYPTNYISMRETSAVMSGIKYTAGSYITRQEFIKVLFNIFDAKCLSISGITSSGAQYSSDGGSVLAAYRSISDIRGTVEGTCYTEIYNPDSSIAPGKVVINGAVYNTGGADYSDLVGVKVRVFVHEDKNGYKVVKALMTDERVKKLSLDSDDVIGYSNYDRKLQYFEDGSKKKTVKLSPAAAVMLNGCAKSDYSESTFTAGNGSIDMYDNDSDGLYDAVYVNHYTTCIADYVSAGADSVYNVYTYDGNSKVLDLEEKENVKIIVYKNGKPADKSAIKKGDVISATKGGNDERGIIRLYVSDKKEIGTISSIKSNDKITVNSKTYELSNDCKSALAANDTKAWKVNAGVRAEIYIDSFGRAAYIKPLGGEYIFGYALKISDKKDTAVRVLDEFGSWHDYCFADKVTFNTEKTEEDELYEKLGGNAFSPQLIKFRLNGENKIREIYTAKTTSDKSYDEFYVSGIQEGVFQQNNLAFSSKSYLEDDVVMWNLSSDTPKDEDDVSTASVSSLYSDTKYTYMQYNADEFGFSKYYVLIETDDNVNFKTKRAGIMVIDAVSSVIDYDGEVKQAIGGMMNDYNDISVVLSDKVSADGLKPGDTVTFSTNSNGEITTLSVIHKRAESDVSILPSVIHTSVAYVGGTLEKYDPAGGKAQIKCGNVYQTLKIDSSLTSIVCEDARGDVHLTKEQFTSAEIGNYVLARVQNSRVTCVVIYK